MKQIRPRWGTIALVSAAVVGVRLRHLYTTRWHDPRSYVYSDMQFYVDLAHRLNGAGFQRRSHDVTHPLGYSAALASLFRVDPTRTLAVHAQLALSIAVPFLVALLAWAAFDRRVAAYALVGASLYFPFVELGAFFLAEVPFIAAMVAGFAALFLTLRVRRPAPALLLAAAGGALLSVATSLKSVAIPAAVAFFVVLALQVAVAPAAPRTRLRVAGVVLATAAGAAPLFAALARVCTRANDGHFCMTGNKAGSDFLLGHYGQVGGIRWTDPATKVVHQFGSPGSFLRHYTRLESVAFAYTDNAANVKAAWAWIVANPGQAVVLSLDHVYDAFFGSAMWPSYATSAWPYAHLSQYAFVAFILVPACVVVIAELRRGRAGFVGSTPLLLAPVLGLVVILMIATGEVRYRVPFDTFLIVLAARFVTVALDARRRRRAPQSDAT